MSTVMTKSILGLCLRNTIRLRKAARMTNGSRLFLITTILAVLAIGLVVLTIASPSRNQSDRTKVTIGLSGSPDVLDLPYYIARDEGYFANEGLDVTFQTIQGDPTTIQAVIGGSLQFASAGLLSTLKAIAQGASLKVFAAPTRSHDYVVVANENVKSSEDLINYTLGVFGPGDITETLLVLYFEKKSVVKDKLQLVSLGGSTERLQALLAKRVDAAILHTDDALLATREQGFHVLVNLVEELPLPMSALLTTPATLEQHRSTAVKIARAVASSVEAAKNDPALFARVGTNVLELPEQDMMTLHAALLRNKVFGEGSNLEAEGVANALAALRDAGITISATPSDVIEPLLSPTKAAP